MSFEKGASEENRARGLAELRRSFAEDVPQLADRADEIQDWEQVKLLTVRAHRLRRLYQPGSLCMGDAAHAMSPVAGVGINVAIQDAVEAANLRWKPLLHGSVQFRDLKGVQPRRELRVCVTQAFQGLLQDNILRPTLGARPTTSSERLGRSSNCSFKHCVSVSQDIQPRIKVR